MIIKYIVKPMLGIPLKWVTKISEVEKPVYFIDEQLSGPYSIWHHQHHFRETRGGIEMTDIVNYQLPLGILGNIAHQIAIKKKVEKIFEYREHKLKELWPKSKLV
jgi:ligand-binding SRPBCC domain-containing protein